MADFFSRIFAIPSDDDDESSASSTYSQGSSIQRHKKPARKSSNSNRRSSHSEDDNDGIEESSTSGSIIYEDDRKKRGRQRRNDAPSSHRSASEGPRGSAEKKKKRSSSERPKAASSPSNNAASLTARRRTARSLSKVAERERSSLPPPPISTDVMDEDYETQRKMKSWRSKFSKGMKKHLSPTEKSPPLPSRSKSSKDPASKSNHRAASSTRNQNHHQQQQPINVGDYITLSQQYLEETDMSVLTLPKELKDINVMEENLQIVMGQRGVLGNNAVQAFLDRRYNSSTAAAANNDDVDSDSPHPITNTNSNGNNGALQVQRSISNESNGQTQVPYEKVSSYATKLLDISYSQSMENTSQGEGVEVNDLLLVYANRQMGAGPCDSTPQEDSVDGSMGVNVNGMGNDMFGSSPVGEMGKQTTFATEKHSTPLDDEVEDEKVDGDSNRPLRSSNKSVSFCLPPHNNNTTSHPPAPPFLGPTFDYYYTMEREPKEVQMPIWSNQYILPPIIELWSSVEGGAASCGNGWNKAKEMELVGEDNPLTFDESIQSPDTTIRADDVDLVPEVPTISPTSPGEKSIEHFNNILDCGDEEEAPLDEKEGLVKQNASSLSIKTDPATSTETGPSVEDANFRHRSQWKSSHNMMYKPPMFNQLQKDSTQHIMGRSESSEDSVLQLRRIHGDDVPSPKKHQDNTSRPVILHGRVVRHANVSPNNASSSLSKTLSIARSPSTASHASSSSSSNAKTYAAIAIQASARGMLERQRFMDMISSVLVIQLAVRRFLSRRRFVEMVKLRKSYFSRNWKRRVKNSGFV